MLAYFLRRFLYAFPILLGVNIITFMLFFKVSSPDDMARMQLGDRHVDQLAINQWKAQHGYDLPAFYNPNTKGVARVTQTLFFQKSLTLFVLNFGQSDGGRNIGHDLYLRMWPSLFIAVPTLFAGLFVNIAIAMLLVFFHRYPLDTIGVVVCTVLMSISGLFYIIIGQYFLGKLVLLFPISGFSSGFFGLKFLLLPVLVSVFADLGSSVRWYRSIFLEELSQEYVKTALAKGLTPVQVLFKHVFKNALLPILTGIVVILPSLFMGSLILESFFAIPGLGSYLIDAIGQQDFAIVRVMVFLGALLYVMGLLLTDLSYVLADPRVRLGNKA